MYLYSQYIRIYTYICINLFFFETADVRISMCFFLHFFEETPWCSIWRSKAWSKTARFTCLASVLCLKCFCPLKEPQFFICQNLGGPWALGIGEMACSYATSDLNKLHRSKKRGSYDKQMVADILDAAVIAHVVSWIYGARGIFAGWRDHGVFLVLGSSNDL